MVPSLKQSRKCKSEWNSSEYIEDQRHKGMLIDKQRIILLVKREVLDLPFGWVKSPFSTPVRSALLN